MIHAATFFLSLGGFVGLLLAMKRHQQDWFRRKLPPALCRTLRLSGFTAMALAFALAGAGLGWDYGAVAWFGWLTISAALVIVANTNRERIMRKVRP
jgi:alkylation response protein AidB-like acyl-CoA dehydrogenase